ncbi:MAG: PEPxxWA-CTERM sorting domain-containing protein [Phenylobacterium sp.]|uniref:PEPxxWA-CTERM sorting domain-containing protein n=1 Tax=Phenylobacterium sp. TaxID=1871053 RepID=UPI00271D0876|nr:PEPxxWA-CTERM sorting domain-containing protein [Phenylobacterium sp.]MDO9433000.1 PEPxxWA-CTERM sorting domain-containing protein [Phenylobacterium sp.]
MEIKKLLNIVAMSAALSFLAAGFAEAATYIANRAIGGGNANISVTTDGTLGILKSANIVDWNITLTHGGDVFVLKGPVSGANSDHLVLGSALSATANDLLFDFSGSGLFLIQAPYISSSQTFWCLQATGCFDTDGARAEGLLIGHDQTNPVASQTYSGVQTIASLQTAVPEPATWAMMIIGFGAVGSMVRAARRNAFSAA